jgi:hypothetical protein
MINLVRVFWDLFNNQVFGNSVLMGVFVLLIFIAVLSFVSGDLSVILIILLPVTWLLKPYIGDVVWIIWLIIIGFVAGNWFIKNFGQQY